LLHGYGDFTLEAEISFTGTVELAFDYSGTLGPHSAVAVTDPCEAAMRNYSALRMIDNGVFSLVTVNPDGITTTHAAEMLIDEAIRHVKIERKGASVGVWVNGKSSITTNVSMESRNSKLMNSNPSNPSNLSNLSTPRAEGAEAISHYPLALICHRFSVLDCTRFAVTGEPQATTLVYNAYDALLGAGQHLSNWRIDGDTLTATNPDICKAKWNVICSAFELQGIVGKCTVEADGKPLGTLIAGETFKATLPRGRHGITLRPLEGEAFAIREIVCYV